MITNAEAEADGTEDLKEKRKYELDWGNLKDLKTIARNKSRKFITGDKGGPSVSTLVPCP